MSGPLRCSRDALVDEAMSVLEGDLQSEAFGSNRLTHEHRAALRTLLAAMADYVFGAAEGRKAFAIPTGGGKTSAIVAFITALHQLGLDVPISVAASRVEALCSLYRALLARGVPRSKLGLKHASSTASEPSTGDESYLFQLVTHARVRGGADQELFTRHQGRPRAVRLYDETMLRAEVFFLNDLELRQAVASLRILADDSRDIVLQAAADFAGKASEAIHKATVELNESPVPRGRQVEMPTVDTRAHLEALQDAVRGVRNRLHHAEKLLGMLEAADQPLSVVATGQGVAAVFVSQVLPPSLSNVVILDASTPIRTLVALDPTIEVVPVPAFKSFEDVKVRQIVAGGGRETILGLYEGTMRGPSPVSRELVEEFKRVAEAQPDSSILVYGFLPRGKLDMLERLRADMRSLGVDPEALTNSGRRRFEFETWGRHEGLNDYAHCETVVLAGVLHLPHAHIAGAIKGQCGDMEKELTTDFISRVVRSEVAHCVYQAASRGSCRVIRDGRARPMNLIVISPDATLQSELDPVMPGARWEWVDPIHLKKGKVNGKRTMMLGRILTYLSKIPEGVEKVLSSEVKQGLGVEGDADDKAFTRAGEDLDLGEHGWERQGRTFVRGATAYGFTAVKGGYVMSA